MTMGGRRRCVAGRQVDFAKALRRVTSAIPTIERWRRNLPGIAAAARQSGAKSTWDDAGVRADTVHGRPWPKGKTPVIERPDSAVDLGDFESIARKLRRRSYQAR
jgi:hypothetical protein